MSDEEMEEGSESSDFSGDEDDYSDESSGGGDDDLSEEGLSWDEMDKQAEEEDRRNAAKR